jgi:demethylmenaquinone methyltransferase/2-methoxy-6-polyprenyl-1,4-benzoquinol methylase
MFGAIAAKYDRANAILSLNLHKVWNRKLIDSIEKKNPEILLDLCAGTGEIAFGWLRRQKGPKTAILLDFCPEMLDVAQQRAPKNHRLSFIEGDAQALPLPSSSVEAISVAYGIRNIKDPSRCFAEAFRTLKPGGLFSILELTEPKNPFLRVGHRLYLNQLLPLLGGLITRKPHAYRYLSESIQAFVRPEVLLNGLFEAGFSDLSAKSLSGGIAHLITAKKPDNS